MPQWIKDLGVWFEGHQRTVIIVGAVLILAFLIAGVVFGYQSQLLEAFTK